VTNDPARTRFLILSSETGGGHASAAAAIADALRHASPANDVTVVPRALEDAHPCARGFAALYNHLLRHHEPRVRYYYGAIERLRPNEWRLFHRLAAHSTRSLLNRHAPHVVISVHPMLQHLMTRALRDLDWLSRVPLVAVVTDPCYGFWRGWVAPDVRAFLVATAGARRQLREYGVAEPKIVTCGMPVHARFRRWDDASRAAARVALGLEPAAFTVLVNAGSIGGGNVPRIFDAMTDRGEPLRGMQAICVAGRNAALRDRMRERAARASFRVVVLPHVDDMERLMNASDVMISKPGGLTIFEALACQLPIVADATDAPMPQEAGAVEMIDQQGAGVVLRSAEEIVATLRALSHDPPALARMRAAAARLATPDATALIVRELTRIARPGFTPES